MYRVGSGVGHNAINGHVGRIIISSKSNTLPEYLKIGFKTLDGRVVLSLDLGMYHVFLFLFLVFCFLRMKSAPFFFVSIS
jgi:hypothetical protein